MAQRRKRRPHRVISRFPGGLTGKASGPPDWPLLTVLTVLCCLGFLMILSASAQTAQFQLRDSLYFFRKQLVWGMLGVVVLVLGMTTSLDRMRAYSLPAMWGSLILVAATYIPHLGVKALGASRWLHLGHFSFQPSEFLKLTLIFFMADLLDRKRGRPWVLADYRQALLPFAAALGLVLLQPDLGTTLILAAAGLTLFFLNDSPLWALGLWIGSGMVLVYHHILHTPYQRERLLAFMDPWKYARSSGFQLIQSLLAIGSGGIFGVGWGQGKQKLFYLPIQHTDFIFSVLAEELGLMGTLGVLFLFVLLAQRGFSIARFASVPFEQLLAAGLTTSVVVQAMVNVGVVTATLPTTGIPLPFLSFGGTSLLVTLFSMGLVLNISRHTRVQLRVVKS